MRFQEILTSPIWSQPWDNAQSFLTGVMNPVKTDAFDWTKITPSSRFEWHQCFGDFQCSRLQVPMDWQGTSNEANKSVELAVIKLAATVSVTDSRYGGAIVLNPGGPGGSGVSQVIKGGHSVRTILSAGPEADPSTARHFDIIGFDPRGVNNTSPYFTCFPDHFAAATFSIEQLAYGGIHSSSTSFDDLWAMNRALAESCSVRNAEEGLAKHMSTAVVARDIIEIFEQHGRWREKEAQRLLSSPSMKVLTTDERTAIEERTAYLEGQEMVQYWGFSYGTILGGTLSTMFPDRVKRVVLDGVAHMRDYMAAGWTTNLRDTDRLLPLLGEYCYKGGPSNCAIYDSRGPSAILESVQKTLSELQKNPVAVPGTAENGPTLITYSDFQTLIWRRIVYGPLTRFTETAQALHELSEGNGTTLAKLKHGAQVVPKAAVSPECKKDGPYSYACVKFALDNELDAGATSGIACSDGAPRTHETKEQYKEYAGQVAAQSELIGGLWSVIMLPCTAWKARPHWRYEGDFRNKTAHPILLVGNTVDPVTPLYNAFEMAKGFEGAGVLHQNSEGHCSYAAPTMCTGRVLREYFQSGKIPGAEGGIEGWSGKGVVCEPDLIPLQGYHLESALPDLPEGETDQEMWKALVQLNQNWP